MPGSSKKVINIHEAKTHLSQLISEALAGEKIIISKAGKPVVKLTRIKKMTSPRRPGTAKGEVWIAPDFDAPLPAELLNDFER